MNAQKYEGINPIEKLHEGEPFFFIRGQDLFALQAIKAYETLINASGDKLMAMQVAALGENVRVWQSKNQHLVKHPD